MPHVRTCIICDTTKGLEEFCPDKNGYMKKTKQCQICDELYKRICKTCDVEKPLSLFGHEKTCKWGYGHRCQTCKTIANQKYYRLKEKPRHKSYNLEWYRKIRADAGCSNCNEDDPVALHAHHIDDSVKQFGISSNLGKPKAILIDELNKCTILCANCHAKAHAGQDITFKQLTLVPPKLPESMSEVVSELANI